MDNSESSVSILLGTNVQKFRKKNDLTQSQLAERIGISQKHLSDIETGTKFPSASIIEKLSKELSVPVAFLFGGTDSSAISLAVINYINANIMPKLNSMENDIKELKKEKNYILTVKPDDNSI